MPDLSREDYIRDQIALHRIRKQVAADFTPKTGQMSMDLDYGEPQMFTRVPVQQPEPEDGQLELPLDVGQPQMLEENSTQFTPEFRAWSIAHINKIREQMGWAQPQSRKSAFTAGQTPAPPTLHHDGEPPCIGC